MKLAGLTALAAASLMLLGAAPTPVDARPIRPLGDRILVKRLDLFHESMVNAMLRLADRHGVEIDPHDVKAVQATREHVLLARVVAEAEDDPAAALLFVSEDTPVAPAGSYVLEIASSDDPASPPEAALVNLGGERFPVALTVGPDPNPERGPRTALTVEGKGGVEGPVYIRGLCYILIL